MRTRIAHLSCEYDGCDVKQHARGYCQNHYQMLRRSGDLLPIRTRCVGAQAKPQGPACLICGRPVMEHGVTEFCQLTMREAM